MRRMTILKHLDDGSYVVEHNDWRTDETDRLIPDTGKGEFSFPNIDAALCHIYDKCSDGKRDASADTGEFHGFMVGDIPSNQVKEDKIKIGGTD